MSARRRLWLVSGITAGTFAVVALVLNIAGPIGVERLPVIAAVIGPRNTLTFLAALLGVSALIVALVWHRARPVLASFAVALLVCVAASAPIALARGIANHPPVAAAVGQLRVLSWNTNGDLVSPTAVAERAADERANIVVLPQTYPSRLREYEAAFDAAHLSMHAYRASNYSELVVFVADSLGEYGAALPGPNAQTSALLVPVTAGLPMIVAIHAAQPTFRGNGDWNADLRWVESHCASPDVIAVGDFNATTDSFGAAHLGRCVDAASVRGAASVGTWPTASPTWLGMPLDHVLTSPGWRPLSFTVITAEDGSGARHRPILAVLARR